MRKRPKINLFLKFIYWLLKGLVLFINRIFYGKVYIINKERLKINQPCILVSNHPSTLMDPLNVACRVNRFVHFLANASLFQSGFTNWFFNTFYCIPVARQKDKTDRKIDNQDSFQRAFDFLSQGGCLYIAPEGVSTQEHYLKPLKTGTARIALGAEAQNNFNLDLVILPVGIYYEDAQRFRKKHVLNVGQPISIHQYKSQYQKDSRDTVRQLTEDLEEQLSGLLIITENPEMNNLYRLSEKVVQADREDSLPNRFKKSQRLAHWFSKNQDSAIVKKVATLNQYLEDKKVNIEAMGKPSGFGPLNILLGLVAPLGFIFNIIPLLIVLFIKKKANFYDGYSSSVLILSSLIIFPIFYRINNAILSHWWELGYYWPLLWLAYLGLGLLCWHTYSKLRLLWLRGRFRGRLAKSEEARDALATYLQLREELRATR